MIVTKLKLFKRNVSRLLTNSKGLTLVELLGVIAILGMVAGIAVPSVQSTMAKAKQDVCNINAVQLEGMYETYLIVNELDHSEELFTSFIKENSKNSDEQFQYIDGEVSCSLSPKNGGKDNEDEVPYL